MVRKPSIAVGDELLLRVDVVRVDEGEHGPTVTFALDTGQRFTIRQDSGDIVDVVQIPKERGRRKSMFDKPD